MNSIQMNRLFDFIAGIQPMMALFWLGLAIFTVALAVLLYTRWGQYRPLRKCMALSILAHLMLASYAATIQIIAPLPPPQPEPIINLTFAEDADGNGAAIATSAPDERPWEIFSKETEVRATDVALERPAIERIGRPERIVRAESPRLPIEPALDGIAASEPLVVEPSGAIGRAIELKPASVPLEKIAVPPAQRREAASALPDTPALPRRVEGDRPARPVRIANDHLPAALLRQFATLPPPVVGDDLELPGIAAVRGTAENSSPRPLREVIAGRPGGTDAAYSNGIASVGGQPARVNTGNASIALSGDASGSVEAKPLPEAYRLRTAPNRPDVARGNGGTAETEAAVAAALKWLADNQDADGRWNPRAHGGGKEIKVLGRDRLGAGSHADSAVTGLALLAFQAAGNTHLDGAYAEDVRRGLEFLLRTQAADGNLGGDAAAFEFMYSHAMAACALSEAYGMTRDARLREPVRRAVAYTLAAQDPTGGGWRYRPGDPGDTSQLGWQLMTLKSAELAGIPIPENTRQGIIRYLRSVSSGRYGGRASYRPGESPSRPMTAEALVCWQFLGLARQHPACNEAGDFVLEQTPGEGEFNLYYWYYATLGMYQLGGDHWQRWNDAMRKDVVRRQVKDGRHAGSWNTDSLWGGYGGRVYTTSLATLTLEVYYRFLPLYAEVARGDNRMR